MLNEQNRSETPRSIAWRIVSKSLTVTHTKWKNARTRVGVRRENPTS